MKIKFICPSCGYEEKEKFTAFSTQAMARANAYMNGAKTKKCPKCGKDMEIK